MFFFLFSDTVGTSRVYSREFLLECSLSQLSKLMPPGWERVTREFPAIVKKVPVVSRYRRYSYNDAPTPCIPTNYSFNNAWADPGQHTYG